jgi:hypothetical protein
MVGPGRRLLCGIPLGRADGRRCLRCVAAAAITLGAEL